MSKLLVSQVLQILAGAERGAPARVAAMLGLSSMTVLHWRYRGRIPAKWQPRLLEIARERGLPLRPEHFFEIIDDHETGHSADASDKRCVAAAAADPNP